MSIHNVELEDIGSLLQEELVVEDRTYRLKSYPNCFIASEAVDYLVEKGYAKNRRHAVEICQMIQIELRHFEHVEGNFLFNDGLFFFRFTDDEKRQELARLDEIAHVFEKEILSIEYKHRMKTYKKCFVGSEAIDYFLVEKLVEDRAEGVKLGESLMNETRLFLPVQKDQAFVDDSDTYYRFLKEEEKWKQSRDWISLGNISRSVLKIGTKSISGVTNGVIDVGKRASWMLTAPLKEIDILDEEEEYISVESTLTRELCLRFIDARKLAAEAKVNLDIHGYASRLQERMVIIEAINIFHERDPMERISLQNLNDDLQAYKSSTHSNASCSSTTAGSDCDSEADIKETKGSRSIFDRLRRRSSSASDASSIRSFGSASADSRVSRSSRKSRASRVSRSSRVSKSSSRGPPCSHLSTASSADFTSEDFLSDLEVE